MFSISEELWLDITNALLGVVTIICIAVVGRVAFREISERVAARKRVPLAHDTHAFNLADLGITMADGGERLDESSRQGQNDDDPPNIIRSNN